MRAVAPRALAGTLLLLAAVGCGRGSPRNAHGAASSVRDSAGVGIVESSAPAWSAGEGWRVDPKPVLQIGAVEGEAPYLFEGIASATRLPDGRIVVVDGGSREIRVFDSTGAHLATLGRRGQGPGEFQSTPNVVDRGGDTLLAFDLLASRYSWFTIDGGFLGDTPFDADAAAANLGDAFSSRILLADGGFVNIGTLAPSNTKMSHLGGHGPLSFPVVYGQMAREDVRLGVVGPGGNRGVVLGRFPQTEFGIARGAGGRAGLVVRDPYFAPTLQAVSRDPVRIHVATGGVREVRTYGRDGALERIVRQILPLRPLRKDAISAFRDAERDSVAADKGVRLGEVMDLVDQITFPDSVFPFSGLLADAGGDLWARDNGLHGDAGDVRRTPWGSTFEVFDPEGRWLGPVRVPASLGRIQEIGDDYVLAVWSDTMDVPYVRMYRLRK